MKNLILSQFTTDCPWQHILHWYDTIDSTNSQAKQLAKEGAPHGTVLVAGCQTGGRGRMGRSFSSAEGMGVYLSVILRPNCPPAELMHLTCAAAVAGCEAVKKACGFCPQIKWINDLVWERKKLGGILTEMSLDSASGLVEYAVVGIGINCCQMPNDFPPELQSIATSIRQITHSPCSPFRLAAALTEALYEMDKRLLSDKFQLLETYRQGCITLGEEIVVIRGEEQAYGTALDLDEEGGLIVQFLDGTVKTVTSGEVSIRKISGYL